MVAIMVKADNPRIRPGTDGGYIVNNGRNVMRTGDNSTVPGADIRDSDHPYDPDGNPNGSRAEPVEGMFLRD